MQAVLIYVCSARSLLISIRSDVNIPDEFILLEVISVPAIRCRFNGLFPWLCQRKGTTGSLLSFGIVRGGFWVQKCNVNFRLLAYRTKGRNNVIPRVLCLYYLCQFCLCFSDLFPAPGFMLFVLMCDHVVFEPLTLFGFTGDWTMDMPCLLWLYSLLTGGFAVLFVGDKFLPVARVCHRCGLQDCCFG